ncbi:hypothetical protein I7I50_09316 [Histoplasma capsulatum G186AR]|uniref:Uncharacterized protein n=1 Tax=Ajellomyces capsulatus TaxID=5037 RepID=A0A8H7YPR7_AJECA|nr:hypothetical protein I7I52_06837 [Histoplasma capsulatum]QSS74227.1 hypothetical protein I7I50_09316 [Histoplasma capsulatum G186AR]
MAVEREAAVCELCDARRGYGGVGMLGYGGHGDGVFFLLFYLLLFFCFLLLLLLSSSFCVSFFYIDRVGENEDISSCID